MAVWGGLTNNCEKKRRENKGEFKNKIKCKLKKIKNKNIAKKQKKKTKEKGMIQASECRVPKNRKER